MHGEVVDGSSFRGGLIWEGGTEPLGASLFLIICTHTKTGLILTIARTLGMLKLDVDF